MRPQRDQTRATQEIVENLWRQTSRLRLSSVPGRTPSQPRSLEWVQVGTSTHSSGRARASVRVAQHFLRKHNPGRYRIWLGMMLRNREAWVRRTGARDDAGRSGNFEVEKIRLAVAERPTLELLHIEVHVCHKYMDTSGSRTTLEVSI